MSVLLKRGVGVETVGVEPYTGLDEQGKEAYGSSTDIEAAVIHQDIVVRIREGTEVVSTVTVLVDAGEDVLPEHQDRITTTDGTTYIVLQRKQAKALDGTLDHVMVRCRGGS